MQIEFDQAVLDRIAAYHLPRYNEIPNVGLYLNQVAKFINEYMAPFSDMDITESMISNYVKKRLVASPVRKQYGRDQIAHLLFIAVAKSVLPLENIRTLLALSDENYSSQAAYDYFCREFEHTLQVVFGIREDASKVMRDNDIKLLMRGVVITVSHKIYLDRCFIQLAGEEEEV